MRILHVIDHLTRFNGMVHAAVDLACQQAKDGHAVSVWSAGGSWSEVVADQGVRLFIAPRPPALPALRASMRSLRRALHESRAEILHAHMVRSALLARWLACREAVPLVTSVQNASLVASALMGVGDGLMAGCEAVRARMMRRGMPSRRVRSVLNGTIGSVRFAAPPRESVTLERPALLTICGLHPRKGITELILAFEMCRAALPGLHLYIIGDGPERARYEAFVARRGIRQIHFCGYIADTRPYMAAADAFVLASRADPAPLVISEAREAGLAVIASHVDGIPEMLEFGEAGLLVRPRSPSHLATAITDLFTSPSQLALWRERSQINITRLHVGRVAAEAVAFHADLTAAATPVP